MPRPRLRVVAIRNLHQYCDQLLLVVRVFAYSSLHTLTGDELHRAHNVLLHLNELGELLGQVRAESTSCGLAEVVACKENVSLAICSFCDRENRGRWDNIPKLLLPKRRLPPLVEDMGGGGRSNCEAEKSLLVLSSYCDKQAVLNVRADNRTSWGPALPHGVCAMHDECDMRVG
jgi:hypothetical protein